MYKTTYNDKKHCKENKSLRKKKITYAQKIHITKPLPSKARKVKRMYNRANK